MNSRIFYAKIPLKWWAIYLDWWPWPGSFSEFYPQKKSRFCFHRCSAFDAAGAQWLAGIMQGAAHQAFNLTPTGRSYLTTFSLGLCRFPFLCEFLIKSNAMACFSWSFWEREGNAMANCTHAHTTLHPPSQAPAYSRRSSPCQTSAK
jgi:hypothetical protein